MAEVVLEQAHKRYGEVVAVQGVDLQIADREFVVLVGPSGCGKSTTLRMIAGLEEITAGTIRIGTRVINHLPPKDRDIAMVFQNYALYQHMSVYDNLAFGLRNRKVPEGRIRQEIARVVQILGIGELLGRRPRQLSGGQQQRVALGRCIVRNPAVFLFDEPLSNLDAKLRAQMRLELKELRERVPTTSIFVTHDQVEAMTLGDRIVVMKDGVVQQTGTPLEVYRRPANLFVAGFIGSPAMNFLDLEVAEGGLAGPGVALALPEPLAARLRPYSGRQITIGVRPEHLVLANGGAGALPSFQARVFTTEQLGAEQLLDARVGETLVRVARIDPELALAGGDEVRLAVPPERLHFFDPDSKAAIV
jgi:multiple sugar transport system ATP-binding protein